MAADALYTGAPTRAPVILAFPDRPISRARRELALCRTHSMFQKWTLRWQDAGLSRDDLVVLACASARRYVEISLAEGC